VFDGTYIWVSNFQATVTRFRLDGKQAGTFNVGTGPSLMAFDGANVWVVNQGDQTVTKLRARDGMNLGTFPATSNAYGIAFDGANIWIAGEPNIVELRPSDGKLIFQARLPRSGQGVVAFDGANLWVANYSDNSVSKL
jgi:sugar lactone lactonase YvrE